MSKLFKKFMASTLALTLVVGLTATVGAAAAKGTDVTATGKAWTSFSIHGKDGGYNAENPGWESDLIKDGQTWAIDVKEEDKIDATKTYGECGKVTSTAANSFNFNIVSTGWSANWGPSGKKDAAGKPIYEAKQSNPWGLTATKVVNVDRGYFYNISMKIKSTLVNDITEIKQRKDGTSYNVKTGKQNFIKHIHLKAFDNLDKDGNAMPVLSMSATQGGKSVLDTSKKGFNNFVKLDSKDTSDDGYVTVTFRTLIPNDKADYQKKQSQATMGIKFAVGAFLVEFPDENNMHGELLVKDFKVVNDGKVPTPGKAKISSVKAKKKSLVVKAKASKATKLKVQVALKKSFKKAKSKTVKSGKAATFKGLKAKKKYYVRARAYKSYDGKMIWGAYSKVKTKKTKK